MTMGYTTPLRLAALFACLPACNDPVPKETGILPEADCTLAVDGTFPVEGADDAYYRSPLEFDLDGADYPDTVSVSLVGPSGAVTGETRWPDREEDLVLFVPDEPLDPSTAYAATLTACDTSFTLSFATSELGEALDADLEGRVWALDWWSGRVVEPYLPVSVYAVDDRTDLLITVTDDLGGTLQMFSAFAAEDSDPPIQDPCIPSQAFPGEADFSGSPYFIASSDEVWLDNGAMLIPFSGVTFSGTFSPDGTWFGGATLAFELDTRVAMTLFYGDFTPEDFCYILSSIDTGCQACTSDGAVYCVPYMLDSMEAVEVPDLALLEREAADEGCK